MPRELWCRHTDCGQKYVSVAGAIPAICPHCERSAAWTSEDPSDHPFALTKEDRKFLRVNRIAGWDEPDDDAA